MRSCSFAVWLAGYTQARQAFIGREGRAAMWAGIGLGCALCTASLAFWRSARAGTNFYESDVYGMTRHSHRVYALVCLVFAACFAASLFIAGIPVVPILGAYAVLAIFYLASFARGFSDEE